MNQIHSPMSTFHFTGQISGGDLFEIGRRGFQPALLSGYGDLSKLRYDFPLVLFKEGNGAPCIRSLCDVVSEILNESAPTGMEGERLRKSALRLEEAVRVLVRDGNKGSLSELWQQAESNLLSQNGGDGTPKLDEEILKTIRDALPENGEVIDYDEDTPEKVMSHAWNTVQEEKARKFSLRLDELTLKLMNILKGDSMKSATAFDPDALKSAVGSSYESAFDFNSMSDILGTAFVPGALPEKRWRRIQSVLSTLKAQKFFPSMSGKNGKKRRENTQTYIFDHCAPAMEAFRLRLPKMVSLVKAMTIAQLEIESRYREATHDPFFRNYDERYLEADDLAMLPAYLICLRNSTDAKAEKADLIEVLSSGLPIKVLAQNDDIVEQLSIASGKLSFGVRGSQLASMALGLNDVFILQASGADLYRMHQSILNGLTHRGPALFSVYSGQSGKRTRTAKNTPEKPLYLRAAAATDSRACPVFVYDPGAGDDWESRFLVDGNPQPERDWPVYEFGYEDKDMQRFSEMIAFTFVDFVAMDDRYGKRFAGVPRSEWNDLMVPASTFMELDDTTAAGKVPYILMIDENNDLHRVIVEARLIQAARGCQEMWQNLRELGGIDNSYARKALAAEKENREAQPEQIAALSDDVETDVESVSEEFTAPSSDEPYIETPRCTTCEECVEINNKMFLYDDNKQAYIADLNAGTYKQLVQAAESCQVAIIHPGKPINPNEPNLKELMARAESFN
ncbi:MAG: ferredoxin [Rhodospirillaceae bacterium]|nr:ferredoxin [Rhodospirillaceae bacterium]